MGDHAQMPAMCAAGLTLDTPGNAHSRSGKTDAKATVVEDGHGAGQVLEAVMGEQLGHGLTNRHCRFVGEPQYQNAGVCSGRVGPDVAKPFVESDEQPALGQSGCCRLGAGVAAQVLGDDRINLVLVGEEDPDRILRSYVKWRMTT